MHINEIVVCNTPTSSFVKEEKRCAFKRPSYTGIPVLVSCMSLRDYLIAACGQSLNSVLFLVILGPSLAFYSSCVYSFRFSSWKDWSFTPSACLQVFLFSGKRIFPNGPEKVFFQKKEKIKSCGKKISLVFANWLILGIGHKLPNLHKLTYWFDVLTNRNTGFYIAPPPFPKNWGFFQNLEKL